MFFGLSSFVACNIVEMHRFLLKFMQDKVKFHEKQILSRYDGVLLSFTYPYIKGLKVPLVRETPPAQWLSSSAG